MAKDVRLSIRTGNVVYLVNDSGTDVTVPSGVLCAGFGPGTWANSESAESINHDKQLLFRLNGHEDLVQFNGVIESLGEVLSKARAQRPEIQLAYHTMTEIPGGNGNFTCEAEEM